MIEKQGQETLVEKVKKLLIEAERWSADPNYATDYVLGRIAAFNQVIALLEVKTDD